MDGTWAPHGPDLSTGPAFPFVRLVIVTIPKRHCLLSLQEV